MSVVGSVRRLLWNGQLEYLHQRIDEVFKIDRGPVTAKEKASSFEYLKTIFARRPKTAPAENIAAAIESCEKAETKVKHYPVLLDYSDTFTGCNIYPPCPKCFSVPEPKIEYAFRGNDFKGLEKALQHLDALSMGGIAELTFDQNYPVATSASASDGMPRLIHPTNGILIERHAKQIVGKVRTLMLSMDAHTPELYGKLQGKPGHFNMICRGLRTLKRLKDEQNTPYPLICMSVVLSKENAPVLNDIYNLFAKEEFGIEHFVVSKLADVLDDNPGRVRGDWVFDFKEQLMSDAEYEDCVRNLRAIASDRPRVFELIDYLSYYPLMQRDEIAEMRGPACPLPWIYGQVGSSGSVNLCCFSRAQVGNWRQDGFENAWNSEKMQLIRKEITDIGVSRHCIEGSCPIVDRLHKVAAKHGAPELVENLKHDFDQHAETARKLMPEVLKGTMREQSDLK